MYCRVIFKFFLQRQEVSLRPFVGFYGITGGLNFGAVRVQEDQNSGLTSVNEPAFSPTGLFRFVLQISVPLGEEENGQSKFARVVVIQKSQGILV